MFLLFLFFFFFNDTATTEIYTLSLHDALPIFRLDFNAGELDDLTPLLDFFGDEPAEVGRRAGKRRAAELSNPRLRPRIGKSGVELLVEPFDDLARRAPWRAKAIPGARLIARQEIPHSRNVREELRTRHRR